MDDDEGEGAVFLVGSFEKFMAEVEEMQAVKRREEAMRAKFDEDDAGEMIALQKIVSAAVDGAMGRKSVEDLLTITAQGAVVVLLTRIAVALEALAKKEKGDGILSD